MVMSGCIVWLNKNNQDLHNLFVDYYVPRMTFMVLARKRGCSDGYIGRKPEKAGGVAKDMLMMLSPGPEVAPYVGKTITTEVSFNNMLSHFCG